MTDKIAAPSTVRISGGVIVREFKIPGGSTLVTHKHPYDHLSFLLSGEARLFTDGFGRNLKGPCAVEIKAGVEHGIFALTDCTWDCLHGLAEAEASGDAHILDGVKELV